MRVTDGEMAAVVLVGVNWHLSWEAQQGERKRAEADR